MAGYLAFDREAISSLRLFTQLALYELNAIVGRDSAAASARACTQRASLTTEAWIPLLQGLGSCMALDAYRPVGLDASDLEQAFLRQLTGGLSIVTDPNSAALNADLIARAEALAKVLRDGELDEFQDAPDKAWLRRELAAIEFLPQASSAFINALGTDRFVELNNLLADQANNHPLVLEHDVLADGTPEVFATIDALGRVFGQFRAGATESELDSWAEALEVDTEPVALVRLVGAGINIDGAWTDAAVQAALTAALRQSDIVRDAAIGTEAINLLAERPTVAQSFLEEIDDYVLQEVLLHYGDEARGKLLLASSDPSVFSPEEVKESMQHVIYVLNHLPGRIGESIRIYDPTTPAQPSWPADLDTYFGQYLPELFGKPGLRTTLGEVPNSWIDGAGSPHGRAHLLALLAEHPDLFNDIEARATAMMFAAQQLGNATLQGDAAYIIGSLADVRSYQLANDIETTASHIELGVAALSYLPFGIPKTPFSIGGVIGLVDASGATGAVLDAVGLDVRDAIAAGQSDNDWLTVVMQHQAVTAWAVRNNAPPPPPLPPKPDKAESGDSGTEATDAWAPSIGPWIEANAAAGDADNVSEIFQAVGNGTRASAGAIAG